MSTDIGEGATCSMASELREARHHEKNDVKKKKDRKKKNAALLQVFDALILDDILDMDDISQPMPSDSSHSQSTISASSDMNLCVNLSSGQQSTVALLRDSVKSSDNTDSQTDNDGMKKLHNCKQAIVGGVKLKTKRRTKQVNNETQESAEDIENLPKNSKKLSKQSKIQLLLAVNVSDCFTPSPIAMATNDIQHSQQPIKLCDNELDVVATAIASDVGSSKSGDDDGKSGTDMHLNLSSKNINGSILPSVSNSSVMPLRNSQSNKSKALVDTDKSTLPPTTSKEFLASKIVGDASSTKTQISKLPLKTGPSLSESRKPDECLMRKQNCVSDVLASKRDTEDSKPEAHANSPLVQQGRQETRADKSQANAARPAEHRSSKTRAHMDVVISKSSKSKESDSKAMLEEHQLVLPMKNARSKLNVTETLPAKTSDLEEATAASKKVIDSYTSALSAASSKDIITASRCSGENVTKGLHAELKNNGQSSKFAVNGDHDSADADYSKKENAGKKKDKGKRVKKSQIPDLRDVDVLFDTSRRSTLTGGGGCGRTSMHASDRFQCDGTSRRSGMMRLLKKEEILDQSPPIVSDNVTVQEASVATKNKSSRVVSRPPKHQNILVLSDLEDNEDHNKTIGYQQDNQSAISTTGSTEILIVQSSTDQSNRLWNASKNKCTVRPDEVRNKSDKDIASVVYDVFDKTKSPSNIILDGDVSNISDIIHHEIMDTGRTTAKDVKLEDDSSKVTASNLHVNDKTFMVPPKPVMKDAACEAYLCSCQVLNHGSSVRSSNVSHIVPNSLQLTINDLVTGSEPIVSRDGTRQTLITDFIKIGLKTRRSCHLALSINDCTGDRLDIVIDKKPDCMKMEHTCADQPVKDESCNNGDADEEENEEISDDEDSFDEVSTHDVSVQASINESTSRPTESEPEGDDNEAESMRVEDASVHTNKDKDLCVLDNLADVSMVFEHDGHDSVTLHDVVLEGDSVTCISYPIGSASKSAADHNGDDLNVNNSSTSADGSLLEPSEVSHYKMTFSPITDFEVTADMSPITVACLLDGRAVDERRSMVLRRVSMCPEDDMHSPGDPFYSPVSIRSRSNKNLIAAVLPIVPDTDEEKSGDDGDDTGMSFRTAYQGEDGVECVQESSSEDVTERSTSDIQEDDERIINATADEKEGDVCQSEGSASHLEWQEEKTADKEEEEEARDVSGGEEEEERSKNVNTHDVDVECNTKKSKVKVCRRLEKKNYGSDGHEEIDDERVSNKDRRAEDAISVPQHRPQSSSDDESDHFEDFLRKIKVSKPSHDAQCSKKNVDEDSEDDDDNDDDNDDESLNGFIVSDDYVSSTSLTSDDDDDDQEEVRQKENAVDHLLTDNLANLSISSSPQCQPATIAKPESLSDDRAKIPPKVAEKIKRTPVLPRSQIPKGTSKPPKPRFQLSDDSEDDDFEVFPTPTSKNNTGSSTDKFIRPALVPPLRIHSTNLTPFQPRIKSHEFDDNRCNTTGHVPVRRSFLQSLSQNVLPTQRNAEASRFIALFSCLRQELSGKLFNIFNEKVFNNKLPTDLPVTWNDRMTKTAGYCRQKRNPNNRTCHIELSVKVCDQPERLRDTLIHEMCHAVVWIEDGIRDGHGPRWKYWANRANTVFPELPTISRCHSYTINTKFIYKCCHCGYEIGRHSKSLDVERFTCGYCTGKFELQVRSKSSATSSTSSTPGQRPSSNGTPYTPRPPNNFALYVKENFNKVKEEMSGPSAGRTPLKVVMQTLSQRYKSDKLGTTSASHLL